MQIIKTKPDFPKCTYNAGVCCHPVVKKCDLDMNTEPTVKRKVVLTIELKPDEGRQVITMSASAKSTLAPTTPIASSLVITSDGLGEMVVAEIVPQIPGQMNIDGGEQEKPRILKIAAQN